RIMREILLAREKPDECPATMGHVISDRAFEYGITRFECVEYRALRDGARDRHRDFPAHFCQRTEVCRQHDTNRLDAGSTHRVCTSTDTTGGRSRTIACHESPASADAYTCPPVVPK